MTRILIIVLILFSSSKLVGQVSVSLDAATRYQTIRGWGLTLYLGDPNVHGKYLQQPFLDLYVNHMGCNAYRWEIDRREWEDYANDDENPYSINWSSFKTAKIDQIAQQLMLPMKNFVEARGEKLWIYQSSSYFRGGSTGTIPQWMLESPAEWAEFHLAHLQYIKNTYGIDIAQVAASNEPDNGTGITLTQLANASKEIGVRLQSSGLSAKLIFPEASKVDLALQYIQTYQNDPDLMNYVTCFPYHLYFGTELDTSDKLAIYNIAKSLNIETAQTEYIGNSIINLYDDLVNGNVSFWHTYTLPDYVDYQATTPGRPALSYFNLRTNYWDIRQVLKYVKQGSVRIDATSSSVKSKVMAFDKNGDVVVVIWNDGDGSKNYTISSLPPGQYAVSTRGTEMGIQTVGASGTLTIPVNNNRITTIYPTHGINQPPYPVNWQATPSYLQGVSSTTLTVSASDPENNTLTYSWAVLNKPAGATVTFGSPNASTTTANGLTVDGIYEFAVTISDGTNDTVQKLVPVQVSAINAPPVVVGLHNRKPVYVTVTDSQTDIRGGGRDPEGDPLTYQWTVISKPAGASPAISGSATTSAVASNLKVAGDYVFRITVSDGTNTVYDDLKVTVHPANTPPQISNMLASPNTITQPANATNLSAATTDVDGELLGHWWTVKSSPAGTKPVFSTQGMKTTQVSGLTLPGTYTFTLAASDNLATVTKDVTVTVVPGSGNSVPSITTSSLPNGTVGVAYSQTLAATGGDGVLSWSVTTGTLPSGLTLNSSTGLISGTPTSVGSKTFTVTVADSDGNTGPADEGTKSLTIQIVAGNSVPSITTSSLPNGTVGVAYSQTLTATGGDGALSWSVTTGSLPSGLTLNSSTGVISGTPTSVGSKPFTVRVADSDGNTGPADEGTKSLTIQIVAGNSVPSITTSSLPNGTVGVAYSQTLTATGGDGALSWSVTTGTLPSGLTLNSSTGLISGTPTSVGSKTFTVTVADSDGNTGPADEGTKSLTIQIVAGNSVPSITTSSLPNGTVGVAYSQTLTATGGDGALSWSVTTGSLPGGLSINNSTGVISGTPTGAGNSSFTVNVSDADGNVGAADEDSQALSIIINNLAVSGISVNPTTLTLTSIGTTGQLTATVIPGNATNKNVSWTSSDVSVASVNSAGLVTAHAAGNVSITVTTQEGSFTATCNVSVTLAPISVTGISVSVSSLQLIMGSSQSVVATISPASATNTNVIWTSDNPTVATVSNTGNISALSIGTAVITATSEDGGFSDTITLTVIDDPHSGNIPKFFSPNNDGIGDLWVWRNITQYQQSEVVVFTRSGKEVFRAKPYQNNWDGRYHGQVLSASDYYYIITFDSGAKEKGAFRIIR